MFSHLKCKTAILLIALTQLDISIGWDNKNEQKLVHQVFKIKSNPQCENVHRLSLFANYLVVNRRDPLRVDAIRVFLCIKYYQYFDLINSLADSQSKRQAALKILDVTPEAQMLLTNHEQDANSCLDNYEKFAQRSENKRIIDVCPHHWVSIEREDRYPFEVQIAVCDCAQCNAASFFDSKKANRSNCISRFMLRPVMYRESSVSTSDEDEEIWLFGLERIPVYCSCNFKIQIY